MSSPATWTSASCIVVLAGLAFVAVSANGDPPNTGMADPVALVSAFDRFAAGGAPANVVILSLSNLRGVSSEAVNAGGRVAVDLATGTVTSTVQLLPPDEHVRPLVDRQPAGSRSHHARGARGRLDEGRHVRRGIGGAHDSRCPWDRRPSPASSRIGRSWSGRAKSGGRVRADGSQHVLRAAPAPSGPLRR